MKSFFEKSLLYFFTFFYFFLFFFIFFFIFNFKEVSKDLQTNYKENPKYLVKKYFLPYRLVRQQSTELKDLKKDIHEYRNQEEQINQYRKFLQQVSMPELELEFKKSGKNFSTKTVKEIDLKFNNLILKKYELMNGFYAGIKYITPGSGYIEFYDKKLIVISKTGLMGYGNFVVKNTQITFIQIENNIDNFIGLTQFNKERWFSIKDIEIINKKVFVSYTDEMKENCWRTSLLMGDFNYKKINFEKIWSPKNCIVAQANDWRIHDGDFNAHQSGGRIINFNDEEILLSIGDYRTRFLAQDFTSVYGSITKINIKDKSHEIIAKGLRNSQGLLYDKKKKFLLISDHGPQGGDEINMLDLNNMSDIPNYGWAVASYGEHYGGKVEHNKHRYQKYPLLKSHSENDFIEPLKYFVPSIGISEIEQINDNFYVLSSLGANYIYFFEIQNSQINNMSRVQIGERIRDIVYEDNKLYLFLESSSSIGVIDLKNKFN